MDLNVKDGRVTLNTSGAVLSPTLKTYVYAGFTNQTIYSCELHGAWANNDNADLCADLHPEKAKLNALLLAMNAARVVLTKTVSFSAVLTIRAALG